MVPPSATVNKQQVVSRPAPVGGLNARDPYAAMPAGDAKTLLNLIPDVGGLRVRPGYREWAINVPSDAAVRSVHAYEDITFTSVVASDPPVTIPGGLFAVTDSDILDITDTTNAPASVYTLSGSTGAGQAYSTMFSNGAGQFLILCSEEDGFLKYDGTTWAAGSTTGVSPGNLVYPLAWKRRLWFVERDSTSAWYLGLDAISGAATEFDFGPLFKHGGYLAYLASWTIDAGEGIDDLLVAVSSSGDVLVYKGTNPASDFGLVGSWFIGQIPVGRKGHCQYGGDLLLLSLDGLFPMSFVTRGGTSLLQASSKEYASKIKALFNQELRLAAGTVGWAMFLHPSERILVVTVPTYNGLPEKQFVLNTTLNAWCQFDNIPVLSTCFAYGYSFAGTDDGRVLLLFTGAYDNVAYGESVGEAIYSVVQPASEYFENPIGTKQFLMIRPLFLSMDKPVVTAGIVTDFAASARKTSDILYRNVEVGAIWDVGLWDEGVWSDELAQYYEWVRVFGTGVSAAYRLEIRTTTNTTLLSVDYLMSQGGILHP